MRARAWAARNVGELLIFAAAVLLLVLALTACRPPACEEDQACWDCSTMGNHQCGPGESKA